MSEQTVPLVSVPKKTFGLVAMPEKLFSLYLNLSSYSLHKRPLAASIRRVHAVNCTSDEDFAICFCCTLLLEAVEVFLFILLFIMLLHTVIADQEISYL
jgi:hypothetical protein